MPEDQAIRSRRHRLHASGDHSECVPGRCAALMDSIEPDFDIELDESLDGWGVVAKAAIKSTATSRLRIRRSPAPAASADTAAASTMTL